MQKWPEWRLGLIGVIGVCLLALVPGTMRAAAQEPGGARWQSAEVGIRDADRLYTPPSGALFASGLFAGLNRSDDGGRTWRAVPVVGGLAEHGPTRMTQVTVAFDPTNHAVAYLAGRDGLYVSTDDALHWRNLHPVTGTIHRIAVSPADPSVVYFVLETPEGALQLWRSRDRGETWSQARDMARAAGSTCDWDAPVLYPHPTDSASIFIQASCVSGDAPGQTPLLMSADQGEQWTRIYEQPKPFTGNLVGGGGADPHRFYLLAQTGDSASNPSALRSDDDGHTWTAMQGINTYREVNAIAYDPQTPDRIFLGSQASEDGGKTWDFMVGDGLDGTIRDLALGVDGRNLFAATDKGVYWLPLLANGAPPLRDAQGNAQSVAVQPATVTPRATSAWEQNGPKSVIEQVFTVPGGAVFARKTEGILVRTEDAGANWVQVDAPTKSFGKGVAVDPTDPGTMYVSGVDGIYKTDNNAKTWKQILPLKEEVHRIAVSPADRGLVYLSVGSGPSRLLRSRDAGQSWETLQTAEKSPPDDPGGCGWYAWMLVPHPTDASRVFAATGCFQNDRGPQGALKLSTDQGQTWTDAFNDPANFPTELVGGRGASPERFYLAATHRLLRSDDKAVTWNDLLLNTVSAVAYDPAHPDRAFIGLDDGGVRGSTDGGATWTDLGAVGANLRVLDLTLSGDGQTLFAATNSGMWRLRLGQ